MQFLNFRETFPLCRAEPVKCPQGFEFFHSFCYRVSKKFNFSKEGSIFKKIDKFMNQPDAVKACKSIHNLSYLPVLNNDAENYAVSASKINRFVTIILILLQFLEFGDAFWLGIARENATVRRHYIIA